MPPEFDEDKILSSHFIEYPTEHNYRQTGNDCGPFNVAAVTRALTGTDVDSSVFADEMTWRLPNDYTLPRGMENLLQDKGLSIETPQLSSLTDRQRIDFLHERLSSGNPVIILGERDDYEHYITLFGFDRSAGEFYAYDSLYTRGAEGFTSDDNADLPGNRTYTDTELLDFWRGSGMYGLYKWYAIVVSP